MFHDVARNPLLGGVGGIQANKEAEKRIKEFSQVQEKARKLAEKEKKRLEKERRRMESTGYGETVLIDLE